jgi:hypothetical protein
MVVHFRARGISRGARKLARTLMLLIIITKKKGITTSLYKNKHTPPNTATFSLSFSSLYIIFLLQFTNLSIKGFHISKEYLFSRDYEA